MKRVGLAFVATALMLATAHTARAQDIVRLGGTGDAQVQSLVDDGQSVTEQVYWRGWGYRGYAGFYRPFAYRPFYRPYAYRPYYGYYRPYYAYRGYANYYAYADPYYAPSYYAPSYYSPPVVSNYANPCTCDTPSMPSAVVLSSSTSTQRPVFQTQAPPLSRERIPTPGIGNGTFEYDGGPVIFLPLPSRDGPTPVFQPKPTPREGRLVALPGPNVKYAYLAYGEAEPPARQPASSATLRVAASTATPAVRVYYPAFGDR